MTSANTLSDAFQITPLQKSDLADLKKFTDSAIGKGYYSDAELKKILEQSSVIDKKGQQQVCSFLLKKDGAIHGVRITYPPGQWSQGKGQGKRHGLSPEKWPFPLEHTAYFQSLFLAESAQGQGWGVRLSQRSIDVLKGLGALGVVCHSWKESPHNSSSRYLEKMGFVVLAEHPKYWKDVDYNCTRCGKPPCQCTALEMYLRLDGL